MMENTNTKSDKNLQGIRREIEKGYEGDPVPFDAGKVKAMGRVLKDNQAKVPNKETIEAMKELEKGEGKRYTDTNEFFKDPELDD